MTLKEKPKTETMGWKEIWGAAFGEGFGAQLLDLGNVLASMLRPGVRLGKTLLS